MFTLLFCLKMSTNISNNIKTSKVVMRYLHKLADYNLYKQIIVSSSLHDEYVGFIKFITLRTAHIG